MSREELHDTPIILEGKIQSDSSQVLEQIVKMALTRGGDKYEGFTHFKTEGSKLFFYDSEYAANQRSAIKLPFNLNKQNAFPFIYECLKALDYNELPVENNGGDGGHGFGFVAEINDFNMARLTIEGYILYYPK